MLNVKVEDLTLLPLRLYFVMEERRHSSFRTDSLKGQPFPQKKLRKRLSESGNLKRTRKRTLSEKMKKKRKATSDAVEILHKRYYHGKPKRVSDLDAARTEDELARKIYQLREQSGRQSR
jgi:hypothetical protein